MPKGDDVNSVAAPFFASALLLVAAGALKARRPGTAVLALRSVGLRVPSSIVRLGGAAEAALGIAALLLGGRLVALAVGASYAAFAGFVVVALLRGGVVSSCGCFGKADTPPTWVHVGVTTAAAAVGILFAAGSAPGLRAVIAAQPLAGLPAVLLILGCSWLGYLVLGVLPTLRRPASVA